MSEEKWGLYRSHLGNYMHRWIARCPWGTLRLHHVLTSDEGRDFHDHPFDFASLILRGGYLEHVPGCGCIPVLPEGKHVTHAASPCRVYRPGTIVRRKAEDFHRLELLDGPALTVVLAGPYRRAWGFKTAAGWVPYEEYHRSFYQRAP